MEILKNLDDIDKCPDVERLRWNLKLQYLALNCAVDRIQDAADCLLGLDEDGASKFSDVVIVDVLKEAWDELQEYEREKEEERNTPDSNPFEDDAGVPFAEPPVNGLMLNHIVPPAQDEVSE